MFSDFVVFSLGETTTKVAFVNILSSAGNSGNFGTGDRMATEICSTTVERFQLADNLRLGTGHVDNNLSDVAVLHTCGSSFDRFPYRGRQNNNVG